MKQNNGYNLSRKWFDFAFEHTDAKCQHTALFMWIIELNNRLGWKETFGLPTHATMEGLHIGNKSTYINALRDLEKWGFIKIVKESKNQYSSTLVSLCCNENATALVSALDTALKQHSNGTGIGIGMGSVPIDKQRNKETSKQENNIDSHKSIFESFRKKYPGVKRGLDTEYKTFQKHKDWKDALTKLDSAITSQIEIYNRKKSKGEFVPEWPMLATWINQRRWEIVTQPQPTKEPETGEFAPRRYFTGHDYQNAL